MKKIFLMLLISVGLFAQKKRIVSFDADTTTRPAAGFYGIGVRDAQPYLVKPSGDVLMFDVHPKQIRGWQFNISGIAPTNVQVLAILKDSLTIDLPNATDTTNKNLSYAVHYFGFNKKNQFKIADSDYLLTFADTIFAYNASNKITYFTKNFTHNHLQSFFRIKPYETLYLYVDNKKWWLSGKPFTY